MRTGTIHLGIAVAVVFMAATVGARGEVPAEFQDLAISGSAIGEVAHAIDPSQPLGSCSPSRDGSRIKIILPNIKSSLGNIRVSLYRGLKQEWMKKGKKLLRFDIPAQKGAMEICMPLPYGPQEYALALYHDEDGDTDYDLSEGYGFSNNAKAQIFGPAKFKKAVFPALLDETRLDIRVRY